MYLITRTIIYHKSGDKQILKEKISTPDLEVVRQELVVKHDCKKVEFVYEDQSEQLPVEEEN
jgi:hypothetical protein